MQITKIIWGVLFSTGLLGCNSLSDAYIEWRYDNFMFPQKENSGMAQSLASTIHSIYYVSKDSDVLFFVDGLNVGSNEAGYLSIKEQVYAHPLDRYLFYIQDSSWTSPFMVYSSECPNIPFLDSGLQRLYFNRVERNWPANSRHLVSHAMFMTYYSPDAPTLHELISKEVVTHKIPTYYVYNHPEN